MYAGDNATLVPTITQPRHAALLYCLLGVVGFSLTLPAMRLAGELDPLLLGPGRGAFAGIVAAVWLRVRGERVPSGAQLRAIALVAFGTVVAFPWLIALALRLAPTNRAVLVIGLAPLATSVFAARRGKERLSVGFWSCALGGAGAVLYAGARQHDYAFGEADVLMLVAVVLVGLGYAEGGRLAQELGGFSVTCWALVLALPCTLGSVATALLVRGVPSPSLPAWLGFGYVALVSTLLGFYAWYRGLALGGVAQGSQVQLLQPVLSLGWCALLLAEPISGETLLTGAAVLTSAVGSRLLR